MKKGFIFIITLVMVAMVLLTRDILSGLLFIVWFVIIALLATRIEKVDKSFWIPYAEYGTSTGATEIKMVIEQRKNKESTE